MPQLKQKYLVGGSLQSSQASSHSLPTSFLQLKNCFVDERPGAVIKRGGSISETLGATVNSPLGLGIYKSSTASLLMPVNIIYMAFFNGPTFRKYESGAWSAVSQNANVSFSSTKQMQFAQIGTTMIMCAGRPARWNSTATEIERVGYPAPSSAATLALGAAGSPNGTYTYVYTYYNSVTGKESDWAPVSASISPVNQRVTVTLPTGSPGSSADQKRLYRTQAGGSVYYFVADVPIATGSYSDNTADAALGLQIRDSGANALPPDSVFICKEHKARVFMIDGSDPYILRYSEGYTGNANLIEYYPTGNSIQVEHEMTGLWSNPASLLIFGVRKISLLSGSSNDDFNIQPLYEGIGTLFANSIVGNGDHVCFLSERGFESISNRGLEHISDDIDYELKLILSQSYGNFIYVSSAWNPAINQFLFSISASTANATPWILSSSGAVAEWEMSATSVTEEWDIPGAPTGVADLTRVKIWGWNPSTKHWTEYEFAQIQDFNTGRYSLNYLVTPYPSSNTLEPQQEATFFGVDKGSAAGAIVKGWDTQAGKDDSTNITASYITGRVQPDARVNNIPVNPGGVKFYRFLSFESSYSDPTFNGATLQYIMDFDDPHLRDHAAALYDFGGSGDKKIFTKGRGRFFYLKCSDATAFSGNILLQSFVVHWVEKEDRETR